MANFNKWATAGTPQTTPFGLQQQQLQHHNLDSSFRLKQQQQQQPYMQQQAQHPALRHSNSTGAAASSDEHLFQTPSDLVSRLTFACTAVALLSRTAVCRLPACLTPFLIGAPHACSYACTLMHLHELQYHKWRHHTPVPLAMHACLMLCMQVGAVVVWSAASCAGVATPHIYLCVVCCPPPHPTYIQVCPITLSLFQDPVCNALGQVYEREALQRHLLQVRQL